MRINLDKIFVVLHKPRYPENIGAAARAACNMGIRRLIVVNPVNCDLTRILKMATHVASDVIGEMEVFDDLEEALSPFHFVVGTTARIGNRRQTMKSPRRLAEELIPITQSNRVAVLFGPENSGLSNDELKYCHSLVTIPTAAFSSINLAQAVMVLAYELFLASIPEPRSFVPRLATRRELEGMYAHIQKIFIKINFIAAENPEHWMQSVRHFLDRVGLRAREVKAIRGICRQLEWFHQREKNDSSDEPGGS